AVRVGFRHTQCHGTRPPEPPAVSRGGIRTPRECAVLGRCGSCPPGGDRWQPRCASDGHSHDVAGRRRHCGAPLSFAGDEDEVHDGGLLGVSSDHRRITNPTGAHTPHRRPPPHDARASHTNVRLAALAYPGGMARAYDVVGIEQKWQRHWEEAGTYQIDNDDPREKFYALCMYPYPSGAAHQGHVRNYTFGELAVRYQTMLGRGVLSPFGFDSFGLPAENAAIKTGTHPRTFTEARIKELKSSLVRLGA